MEYAKGCTEYAKGCTEYSTQAYGIFCTGERNIPFACVEHSVQPLAHSVRLWDLNLIQTLVCTPKKKILVFLKELALCPAGESIPGLSACEAKVVPLLYCGFVENCPFFTLFEARQYSTTEAAAWQQTRARTLKSTRRALLVDTD